MYSRCIQLCDNTGTLKQNNNWEKKINKKNLNWTATDIFLLFTTARVEGMLLSKLVGGHASTCIVI